MVWKADAPQGNESAKIKYEIVPYTRGRVLELGSGPWRTFPHFTTVDNQCEWGTNWKPDFFSDATDLSLFASQSCDAVFSSHLLEHIEDYHAALQEWWRVVKPNGYLLLYICPIKIIIPISVMMVLTQITFMIFIHRMLLK